MKPEVSYSLGAELQAVVSHPVRVLGTELRASERTIYTFNH